MRSWTAQGDGIALPDTSSMRVIPGTENPPSQRRAALLQVARHAKSRDDFLETVQMLGLRAELAELLGLHPAGSTP